MAPFSPSLQTEVVDLSAVKLIMQHYLGLSVCLLVGERQELGNQKRNAELVHTITKAYLPCQSPKFVGSEELTEPFPPYTRRARLDGFSIG